LEIISSCIFIADKLSQLLDEDTNSTKFSTLACQNIQNFKEYQMKIPNCRINFGSIIFILTAKYFSWVPAALRGKQTRCVLPAAAWPTVLKRGCFRADIFVVQLIPACS
jgi:hypothetical protein